MNKTAAGYVSDELYSQVTATFPIICVDVIPFDAKTNRIGIITRATGKEAGNLALIGGRIQKNESIQEAINRHLVNDLQVNEFTFYSGNTATRPFYVQQYFHRDTAENGSDGYDPSKHSIGLNYIINIDETPIAKAEAANFLWINESEVPEQGAFNQGTVMREAFTFIAKTSS